MPKKNSLKRCKKNYKFFTKQFAICSLYALIGDRCLDDVIVTN